MTVREPSRLMHQLEALTEDERAELRGYVDDAPNDEAQLRMLTKLQQSIGADARSPAQLQERSPLTAWSLGALSLAVLVGVVLWSSSREPELPARPSAQRAVQAVSTEAPARLEKSAADAEKPAPEAEPAPKTARELPRRTRAARSDPLEELKLLSRARRVLPTQPESALRLTEEHAAAYPAGTFAEEREVLAIEALQKLERVKEAARRARAFIAHYPSSSHGARLRAWLASSGREP